jgi:hypothetical protein
MSNALRVPSQAIKGGDHHGVRLVGLDRQGHQGTILHFVTLGPTLENHRLPWRMRFWFLSASLGCRHDTRPTWWPASMDTPSTGSISCRSRIGRRSPPDWRARCVRLGATPHPKVSTRSPLFVSSCGSVRSRSAQYFGYTGSFTIQRVDSAPARIA